MQDGGVKITSRSSDVLDRCFLDNSHSGEDVIGTCCREYLVSEKARLCPSTSSLRMAAGAQYVLIMQLTL